MKSHGKPLRKFGAVFLTAAMKKELIYFAVFIYGMIMLMALSTKKSAHLTTSSNGHSTKTYKNRSIKEEKTVAAQRFFSSNQRFTLRFSDNELSFLY